MTYPFLQEFILTKEYIESLEPKEKERLGKLRHKFYILEDKVIQEALNILEPFPAELKQFWQEIGFGYFHCNRERANRIFDPYSLTQMNNLEDRFKYDTELERALVDGHLVFFHTSLYQFLTIERKDISGKNAVYYKKQKLSDSLLELLTHYDKNRNHLPYMIKNINEEEIKQGIPQATPRNTFVYKSKNDTAQKSVPAASPMAVIPKEENVSTTENAPQKKPEPASEWSALIDDDDVII
jgi:hypothetical protein